MSESVQRRGPLSAEEKAFIQVNAVAMTPEEMADELGRNPRSVKKYLADNSIVSKGAPELNDEDQEIIDKLHNLAWWPQVSDQFDVAEIHLFERIWLGLIKQFDEDILDSEELQVRKYITMEIMKDRSLKKIKGTNEYSLMLEEEIRNQLRLEPSDRDRDMLTLTREELSGIKHAVPALNKEYQELCKEQAKIEEGLSASRNQRITNIQDATKNWSSVLKMLEDPSTRKKVGQYIEIVKAGRDKEMRRLTDIHQYIDGTFDRPILSGKLEHLYEGVIEEEKRLDSQTQNKE